MEKTYKLTLPESLDPVAKTAWRLMERSHELFECDGHLVVVEGAPETPTTSESGQQL